MGGGQQWEADSNGRRTAMGEAGVDSMAWTAAPWEASGGISEASLSEVSRKCLGGVSEVSRKWPSGRLSGREDKRLVRCA